MSDIKILYIPENEKVVHILEKNLYNYFCSQALQHEFYTILAILYSLTERLVYQ